VAAEGKNYLVMGAESLSTLSYGSGSQLNVGITRNVEKIYQLSDHVAVLIAGDSDIGQNLIQEFCRWRQNSDQRRIDWVTRVANQFSNWCKENFIDRYSNVPLGELPVIRFLVVGLNKIGRGYSPRIYKLDSWRGFYPGLSTLGFDSGGISFLADYLFKKLHEEDLTLNEIDKLLSLVAFVIQETINSGQAHVGGEIKLAYIDSTGFHRFSAAETSTYLNNFPNYYGERLYTNGTGLSGP
jgi:20S proteasome alpha/beta subunit